LVSRQESEGKSIPRVSPLISNFGTGEISPKAKGRVDADRYKQSLDTCENYVPTIQGGLIRRSGSSFVAEVKDSTKAVRLERFEFNTTQAYIIEFGDYYIRFYKDNGAITETGVAITGATAANPVSITAVAHGFTTGDDIEIASVGGMTELNGRRFRVVKTGANTFTLTDNAGTAINGTAYTAYTSGGTASRVYTKPFRTITSISRANPAVVTSVGHGFSTGDHVYIQGCDGMPNINGRTYKVGSAAADTFNLLYLDGHNVNTNTAVYPSAATTGTVSNSPYSESEVFDLKFTQSADVLYITHPSHPPRKLSRSGHTSWSLSVIDFADGPFLGVQEKNDGTFANTASGTNITLTPSASTGLGITITASSALWNFPTVDTGDVGRLVRIKNGGGQGYAKIIANASNTSTVAYADVIVDFTSTSATSTWKLGAFSNTTGFPAFSYFHEDRLCFGSTTNFPQRFWHSYTAEYENFSPSSTGADAVSDVNSFYSSLNSGDVNSLRWATSDEKGLLMGTVSSEWIVKAGSSAAAMSPTNISQKKASNYGSENIAPIQVGKTTLFVQRAGRTLREILYFYDVDGYQSQNLTLLAEHIAGPGFTQLAFQKEPISLLWAVRDDGQLCAMTYERDIESLRAGWSRHIVGGYSNSGQTADAIVESVACIPNVAQDADEVWIVVKRYINGRTVRYVEYLNDFYDDLDEAEDLVFVDGSVSYDGSPTSTVTGLWHLIGQSVSICADGMVLPNQTVPSTASLTLSISASKIHVGLPIRARVKLLRFEAGSANGTAIGKNRATHRAALMLHRTTGMSIGYDFDSMDEITFRTSSDPMNEAVPLFTGIKSLNVSSGHDFENQLCIEQTQPLPGMILAIAVQMDLEDRQ